MFTQNFLQTWTGVIKTIITAHDIYGPIYWVRSMILFLLTVLKINIKWILLLFLVYLSWGEINAKSIVRYNKWILLYVIDIALFKWLVLLWAKGKSEIYALSGLLSYLACKRAVKYVCGLKSWVQGAKVLLICHCMLLFLLLRGGPLLIA